MKRTILFVALAMLMALGGQAFAELCTIDTVPAATLLIPSFKVDVSEAGCASDDDADPLNDSLTTIFSVTNASAAPTVAHVTIWSDQTIPVLDFDIYLTGYDVQSVNLRQVFCDGILPQTGFGTVFSPVGAFSQTGMNPPGCGVTQGNPPVYDPFDPLIAAQLRGWLTGSDGPLFPGQCVGSGQKQGDPITGPNTAVGYITIDQTNECTLAFPSDDGYFTGTAIGFENILMGEYFVVDGENAFSQGFNAVHIEAAPMGFFPPGTGSPTFYGRYTGAVPTAADRREPLGTTYAARYLLGAIFDGTKLNVWREGGTDDAAYACVNQNSNGTPSWWPLGFDGGTNSIVIFDEAEMPLIPEEIRGPSFPDLPPDVGVFIPNEVNHCEVGVDNQPFCFIENGDKNFGWIYMNLQADEAVWDDPISQNWVTSTISAAGRYSVGFDAVQLDSACQAGLVAPPTVGPIPNSEFENPSQ